MYKLRGGSINAIRQLLVILVAICLGLFGLYYAVTSTVISDLHKAAMRSSELAARALGEVPSAAGNIANNGAPSRWHEDIDASGPGISGERAWMSSENAGVEAAGRSSPGSSSSSVWDLPGRAVGPWVQAFLKVLAVDSPTSPAATDIIAINQSEFITPYPSPRCVILAAFGWGLGSSLNNLLYAMFLQHEQVIRVPLEHLAAQHKGGLVKGEGLVQPAQLHEGPRLAAHRLDPARVLGRQHPLVDREHAVVLLQGTGVVVHAVEKATYKKRHHRR